MERFALRYGFATEDLNTRLAGLALYASIVVVAWLLLPKTLPFVLPASAFGMVMHAGPRRPWLGFAGFWVLLLVVPGLFFTSLLTEAFAGLTGR
jgi:hypothetical protein